MEGKPTTDGADSPNDPTLADALLTEHARLGITPDGWTAGAKWKWEKLIPDDILHRAAEAIAAASCREGQPSTAKGGE